MSYNDNPDHKMLIDEVLHRCAIMFQNLGAEYSKEDYQGARADEVLLLKAVRHLDPEKIDRLLANTDQ